MADNYFINTAEFSIEKFKDILKTKDILPGRIILKEKTDERFEILRYKGIHSLKDLLDTLKTKSKIEKFAEISGLDTNYLSILRREANSYIPAPVKLKDLPFKETDIIEQLESKGINNSKQLFATAAGRTGRKILAEDLAIPDDKLLELTELCDLIRITGIGPVFARIIYDSGIRSAHEFLERDAENLYKKLINTNEKKGLTKVRFSIKDIEYCLELGKDLPLVLER